MLSACLAVSSSGSCTCNLVVEVRALNSCKLIDTACKTLQGVTLTIKFQDCVSLACKACCQCLKWDNRHKEQAQLALLLTNLQAGQSELCCYQTCSMQQNICRYQTGSMQQNICHYQTGSMQQNICRQHATEYLPLSDRQYATEYLLLSDSQHTTEYLLLSDWQHDNRTSATGMPSTWQPQEGIVLWCKHEGMRRIYCDANMSGLYCDANMRGLYCDLNMREF